MRIQLLALLLAVSLPACAQHGKLRPTSHHTGVAAARFPDALILAQTEGGDDVEVGADAAPRGAEDKTSKLPAIVLTRELLYKFLLAEIAAQRGNVRLATRAYIELAQSTRDPRVARRATEVAMYGRLPEMAAESSSLWLDIEPDSQQAKQTLMAILVGNADVAQAKPQLQRLLAADKARTGATFLQLNPLLSRYPDKAKAFELVRDLAKPYPQLPEAHFALAQAAIGAGRMDVAEAEVAKSLELKADFEPAAILNAQLIQRESTSKAVAYLHGFVGANPKARDARLFYARLLAADKRPNEARQEFLALEKEVPNNAEVAVMIGLLSLQMQDLDGAEQRLRHALELQYRDPDMLRFYLGQIAEERGRADEALEWYQQVQGGEQMVPAAARLALLLGKRNQVAEAREYLHQVQTQTPQQRVMLVQAEAQVLREAKSYKDAFDVIAGGLEGLPDQPELLYDLAMAAEKLDRIDVLEEKLKRLIEIKPDHAQAYNALGYTLADRNLRLPEARDYIAKALSLAPEDAFILDSMGWVEYRLGNLEQGLGYMKRAFSQRQDPEIAAHLGEMLWASGDREGAERVWRESLRSHPGNEELQAVMGRFLK